MTVCFYVYSSSACDEVLDIASVKQSPLESLLKEKKRAKAKNLSQPPKEKSFVLESDTETEAAPKCESGDVSSNLDVSMKSSSQESSADTVIVSESQGLFHSKVLKKNALVLVS